MAHIYSIATLRSSECRFDDWCCCCCFDSKMRNLIRGKDTNTQTSSLLPFDLSLRRAIINKLLHVSLAVVEDFKQYTVD